MFKTLVLEVFGIDESEFSDDKTPEDVENWTSVTHMELMGKFEETFNIELDVEDITEMDSFENMCTILKKYGVDL